MPTPTMTVIHQEMGSDFPDQDLCEADSGNTYFVVIAAPDIHDNNITQADIYRKPKDQNTSTKVHTCYPNHKIVSVSLRRVPGTVGDAILGVGSHSTNRAERDPMGNRPIFIEYERIPGLLV